LRGRGFTWLLQSRNGGVFRKGAALQAAEKSRSVVFFRKGTASAVPQMR
jgi:hypothetical protein